VRVFHAGPTLVPRSAALIAVLAAVLAVAGARPGATVQAQDAVPALFWEATGFTAPESVVFDAGRKQFYVSNMGTWGQGATPGDGFISRLGADGRVLDLRWIAGFESPKGLALANGRLYVADDADLVEIDPGTGAIVARHKPADGPGGFNDCTVDARGTVYVFSRRLSTVFRLRDGRFEPWTTVDAAKTGWPNGLLADRDRLLLGSWLVRGADGAERFGILSAVAYADGAVTQVGNQRIGNIDGIEPDGRGGYTVTDWVTGDVLRVTADGVPTRLMTLRQGAADHLYVVDQRLLVVPLVRDHVVKAFRWDSAAR
jgi:hypothetical protein